MTAKKQPKARAKRRKRYKPGSFMDLYMAVSRYVQAQGGCVVGASGISTIRWPGGSFTIGVRCTGRPPSYDATQTDLMLPKTGGTPLTPAIPAGYRRLRVGEKRPKGYQYLDGRVWVAGFPLYVGIKLSKQHNAITPYIAPVALKSIGIRVPKRALQRGEAK